MYAQDSIDMLTQAGIRFKRHEEDGINPQHFAELIISSGLILCEEITWITFGRYNNLCKVDTVCLHHSKL